MGRRNEGAPGDRLVEIGDTTFSLFLVLSGAIQVLRPNGDTEAAFITYGPGQFSGETTPLTGRPMDGI